MSRDGQTARASFVVAAAEAFARVDGPGPVRVTVRLHPGLSLRKHWHVRRLAHPAAFTERGSPIRGVGASGPHPDGASDGATTIVELWGDHRWCAVWLAAWARRCPPALFRSYDLEVRSADSGAS